MVLGFAWSTRLGFRACWCIYSGSDLESTGSARSGQ